MVFGAKPKKPLSIKPGDKRKISLLNADFKIVTAIEADKSKPIFTYTLSPFQLVAGSDRRIHHGINKARDCIHAVSKSKVGCALVGSRTFSYQTFSYQTFSYQDFQLPRPSATKTFSYQDFQLPRLPATKTFSYQDFVHIEH